MQFSLVLATLLCYVTWMSFVHATHGRVSSCCMQWSTTRVSVEQIKNYTIQFQGVCPVKAVKFVTVRGNRICSDPNTKWAKKAILKVDKETKMLLERGQKNEDGLTSVMTPAASTASKKLPRKRAGKRRLRKKTRRGRKGQKKHARGIRK